MQVNEAQITLAFMTVAILFTAGLLRRNKALGTKALLLVIVSTLIVASFLFLTL
ncbi:hypothetical protein MSR1_10830 [Magnetospirillum gryphiswaldense MSR-1]|uniref:Membrane protein n=1 Tax=Magnetospirillum gryphiswaldense TaxID=55518 RepID=A4TVM5_9PROT|nr:hypothetical protein MSR1_10830 [Magnetospirillum gryphiswaldense MSR-1]AVM77485.1 hypothetical protein MSR1L_10830 [Magnetospirillum gryphiswaldense]CAM74682.1 membrane protein [Magnetospirillum gryphiswaldense MSR-1]